MSQRKVTYGLYQTFSDIKEPSRGLSSEKKKKIKSAFSRLTEDQREAFFMLVCEHARQNDEFDYDPENIVLPYDIVYSDNQVEMDLKNLPPKLQYILWRFLKVLNLPE